MTDWFDNPVFYPTSGWRFCCNKYLPAQAVGSTVLAGFSKIDSVISGCFYTDDDESSIADLARSLGVNLKFTSYTRYCTKER